MIHGVFNHGVDASEWETSIMSQMRSAHSFLNKTPAVCQDS